MVSDLKARPPILTDAIQMRQQAQDLFDRLMTERDRSELRLAEAGKRDPMRAVTGQTALDRAIASARDMINRMDDLLAQMGHRGVAQMPAVQFPARRVFKPLARLANKSVNLPAVAKVSVMPLRASTISA